MNDVELYVRYSGGAALLMLHAPEALRSTVLAAIKNGELDSSQASIHLELSILPEWITDPTMQKQVSDLYEQIHIRVPISSFNINFSE